MGVGGSKDSPNPRSRPPIRLRHRPGLVNRGDGRVLDGSDSPRESRDPSHFHRYCSPVNSRWVLKPPLPSVHEVYATALDGLQKYEARTCSRARHGRSPRSAATNTGGEAARASREAVCQLSARGGHRRRKRAARSASRLRPDAVESTVETQRCALGRVHRSAAARRPVTRLPSIRHTLRRRPPPRSPSRPPRRRRRRPRASSRRSRRGRSSDASSRRRASASRRRPARRPNRLRNACALCAAFETRVLCAQPSRCVCFVRSLRDALLCAPSRCISFVRSMERV